MSQMSVQTSVVHQPLETTSTQGTHAASSAREVPAALLARISGSAADKPAFDPALLHKDSFLPHVAEQLANRPLGDSEGAKAAAEMLELTEKLQGKPVTDEELSRLEELRSRAWKSDRTGDAGAYCDTLACVMLLRPLMEKLEAIDPPEARAQLADVLHSQMDRLLSAETPQEFEQIMSELRATQELFKQQGIMGQEQEGAFKKLNDLLQLHRKVYTETFPALEKDAMKVMGHEKSARTIDSVLKETEALRDGLLPGDTFSKIPFGEMGFQPLQAKAGILASRLYNFSKEEAGNLAGSINTLLAEVRNPETSLKDVDKKISELRNALEEKAGVLTEYDRLELQKQIDCLAGAVEVRGFVTSVERVLGQKDIKAAQLESLQAECKGKLDDLALPPEERQQVADALKRLGSKTRELRDAARLEESHFAAGIEKEIESASTSETYDQLARQIDARLEKLTKLPDRDNLSPEDKAAAVATLKNLAQQCLMGEFTVRLTDAQSTRRNMPSVAECAEHVNDLAEKRGVDPGQIREQLAEISGNTARLLDAKIAELQARIPSMSAEELRTLRLEDIAEAMERRLLPTDREALDKKLASLVSQAEEALFAKTVGPELKGAFSNLDESQKAILKEFCIQGGCHPSLVSLLQDAAGSGGLADLLEAAGRIFAAKHENREPALADIEQVDAFLLPHPELDDVARDILSSDGKGTDYRFHSARNSRDLSTIMDKHFPRALKSKLGLQKDTPVGVDTLKMLVQLAADGHGGKALKKVELTLIQALWYAEKTQHPELSFDTFKQSLPRPFATMPMLEEYLAAGISGRRELKQLAQRVEDVSHGLGSKKALVRFLVQAWASDPKWSAGAASSGLYRSLGVNPHSDLTGVFQDTVQDTQKYTAEQKKQSAGAALESAQELRFSKAKVEEAERTIKGHQTRNEMAGRLGIRPESRNPDIKGATLATGILMAEKILSDPATENVKKQNMLNCIHFQQICKLDGKKMKGFTSCAKNDKLGGKFRELLRTLREADLSKEKENKEFEKARGEILQMCSDSLSSSDGQSTAESPELRKRAEAVLYFKQFSSLSTQDQIEHEFKNIEKKKENALDGLSESERRAYDSYKNDVIQEMRLVIGTGQRQGKILVGAAEDRQKLSQDADNALKEAQNRYTKEERNTLSKAASLVICEQFAQSDTITTVADIKNQFERHSTNLKEWPFYANCLDKLTEMGLPEEAAELYLQKTLSDMKEDFFARLAQKGLQGTDSYSEIDRMVGAWMSDLEDTHNSLTFKKSHGASVEVPIVEAGVAEVSAHLEVARENGISVWKGDDGQYNMTLMKGAKVGLGVGVKVELDSVISAVEAKAGVNVQGGVGCDLTFPNKAQCHMFLSGLLSGRACAEHLGLCNGVRSVREAGLEANAELTLGASVSVDEDVDILSVGITGGAEISGMWTTTQDRDQKQYTRTVRGSVSLTAEASVGPEDLQDMGEAIGEKLENIAYVADDVYGRGDAAQVLQAAKPQLSVEATLFHREFEEQRSVVTKTNGTLGGSERVRAFVLSSKTEAVALLRNAGVSQQTIGDVLADLRKLPPGEEFRIELASSMRPDAVQAYNTASARGEKPSIRGNDFALQEVRLVTEDSFERTNTLNLRILKLQSGRSLSRTHTETYDARPVLEQAA